MGDELLPVEKAMTGDKAGWGLVPGLQALLLHIHTQPPLRGQLLLLPLGWAGRAARSSLHTHLGAERGEKPLFSDQPRSQGKKCFSCGSF